MGTANVERVAKGFDIANQPEEQEETAAQNSVHDLSMDKPSGEQMYSMNDKGTAK